MIACTELITEKEAVAGATAEQHVSRVVGGHSNKKT